MPRRWRIATHDPHRVAELGRAAGVPAVVAHLLLCRGIEDPDLARQFLDAKLTGLRDPDELPGVATAAELIHQAIADGRRIVVYGDYDADGMTASAILLLCLRLLRANVTCYVPNRIDEGYGLNEEAVRSLAAGGAEVIITVDCGIASVHEADVARQLGVALVITDHHQLADRLPNATALVHPRLPGHDYPFDGLCGAAVALKLAWAICQRASGATRVSEAMRNMLMQAVGLAAIGTVADVVPLVDENRILVRHGLNCLRHFPTKGMAALERVAGIADKRQLDGDDIGFTIAPRLNAAGRLGQAMLAIELLTTNSDDRANELARFINDLNEQRQTLERSVYRAANKLARDQFNPTGDPALVLCDDGWHPGVIGIVAGKLSEKYQRPVLVISRDELGVRPSMGSGRSVPGVNLHEALAACTDHLVSHGGHAMAAGLKIEARAIDAFRIDFCAHIAEQMGGDQTMADLLVDAETPLAALTHQTVTQIEQLAPFGNGNQRPLLCTSQVHLAGVKRIGKTGSHLSLQLEQNGIKIRGVAFGGGDWEDDLTAAGRDGPLAVAYKPVINTFRGRSSVEIHLTDWRSAGAD
jgi:single-stranded-DNA-specific exonuclease